MKVKSLRLWFSALIALCCIAGACRDNAFTATAHQPPSAPRNYGVVWSNRLTRSGMPKDDSGWIWLHDQGVKSIVTFRKENDVDYKKFGFNNVLHMPMGSNPPTDAEAEEFLRFIQEPRNQPVHIHCEAGQSRTGLMAALARYAIDGWPLDKALNEARHYRQGRDLSKKRVDWLKGWAAQHPAGSFRVNP